MGNTGRISSMPASALHRFQPQAVLFSLTAREAISGVALAATAAEADGAIGRFVAELRSLWRRAREIGGAAVIQQTFLDVTEPLFGGYDRMVPGAPGDGRRPAQRPAVRGRGGERRLILDVARASQRDGIDAWFDVGRWLQGKLEIAPQAAPLYGDLAARILAALRGLSKKCLVLDLDNTLWGGVIGDDGLDGIVLGEGSAAGEAHLALQRYAKQLKERGVILAVCSKNDAKIAEAAFRDHPEMVLRRADIAVFQANWDDKAQNLKAIAAKLNIGFDSLVFVDDNPIERARVRQSLPMVAVPEMPDDPAHYVRCLADAGYFEAVAFTADDREPRRAICRQRRTRGAARVGGKHGRLPPRAQDDSYLWPVHRRRSRPRRPAHQQDQPIQHHDPPLCGRRDRADHGRSGFGHPAIPPP